jgi:hypothetical protein
MVARKKSLLGRYDSADIAAEQKAQQQRLANALEPSKPETSWTQGAARMVEAAMAASKGRELKGEQEAQRQQYMSEQERLAQQLSGGAQTLNAQGMSQYQSPDLRKAYMEEMIKEKNYARSRQDKKQDQTAQWQHDDVNNPERQLQQQYYKDAQVASDPAAPENIRAQAKERMKQTQSIMIGMHPKNTGGADGAGGSGGTTQKYYDKEKGQTVYQDEKKAVDSGINAKDTISRLDQINSLIEQGRLTNANMTNVGQALETGLARLNLPNDTAAIGKFIQTTNKQILGAREYLKGTGSISNYEQGIASKAEAIQPDDTMEAVVAKVHTFKQMAQRMDDLGQLTQDWQNRYGNTINKSDTGVNFNDVKRHYIETHPLTSYEDEKRAKEDAASEQVLNQQKQSENPAQPVPAEQAPAQPVPAEVVKNVR